MSRRRFLHAAAGTVAGVLGAGILAPGTRASETAGPLSPDDIIRAWKDEDFRRGLPPEQLAQLPQHPSGDIEVQQTDLGGAAGIRTRGSCGTCGRPTLCCCRASY